MSTENQDTSVETTTETTSTEIAPKTYDDFKNLLKNAAKKATEAKSEEVAEEGADPKADTASTKKDAGQASTAEDATAASSAKDAPANGSPAEDDLTKQADVLAELGKRDQVLKNRDKKLAQKAKELEERAKQYDGLEPIRVAREKLTTAKDAKERAAALLELAAGNITTDDLAEMSALAGNGPPPITAEDIRREAIETYKKQQEEERKRQEETKAAELKATEEKENGILKTQALPYLQENADKFPALKVRPANAEEVKSLMREGYRRTGQLPTWEEIFTFINDQRAEAIQKEAELLGYVKPAAAKTEEKKPEPVKTISNSDKRGAPPAKDVPKPTRTTLDDDRAAFRKKLREMARQ